MRKILQLKPWQLFIIYIFGYLQMPGPFDEIIALTSILIVALWEYSVGYYGEHKLRMMGMHPKSLRLYQFNCLYLAALLIFVYTFFMFWDPETADADQFMKWTLLLILPIFYAVFAVFQVAIFTSQTLAELEKRKPADLSDYGVNILLFMFFFVGVWFLVPKAKKYLADEFDEENLFESI